MKNDDVSIEKSVNKFRALVLFTNERRRLIGFFLYKSKMLEWYGNVL